MTKTPFHILRVGVAITFLWIGILIFKEPEAWAGYIQPWAVNLLPLSLKGMMIGAAVLDIFIGILLLVDYQTWLASLLASLHLFVVIAVSGINAITVRDIGLLAATLALTINGWPGNFRFWRRGN